MIYNRFWITAMPLQGPYSWLTTKVDIFIIVDIRQWLLLFVFQLLIVLVKSKLLPTVEDDCGQYGW